MITTYIVAITAMILGAVSGLDAIPTQEYYEYSEECYEEYSEEYYEEYIEEYCEEYYEECNEKYCEELYGIEDTTAQFTDMICEDFILDADSLVFYYTDELDYDTLTTRNEREEIIVEILVGEVVDDDLNGVVLTTDTEFDYISYSGLDFVNPGDLVATYLIYNTENNYEDDFERYDYPLDFWE